MNRIHQQPSRKASRTMAVMGAFVLALSGSVAYGGTQCYDFSGPAPDTVYQIGQTVNARHSVIHLQKLMTDDGPMNPGDARIENTPLPQGQVPALGIQRIVTQVVPQKRVQRVTFKFAENTGPDDQQVWNFGANGDRRVWKGRLSELNGQYLGKPEYGGRVRVTVNAVPDSQTLPTWVRGTVTLEADPAVPLFPKRGIGVFAMGRSSQLKIDDVCLTQ